MARDIYQGSYVVQSVLSLRLRRLALSQHPVANDEHRSVDSH
jgi:hypothetical protein